MKKQNYFIVQLLAVLRHQNTNITLSTRTEERYLITKFVNPVEGNWPKSQTEIDIYNSFMLKIIMMMLQKMNYQQWHQFF